MNLPAAPKDMIGATLAAIGIAVGWGFGYAHMSTLGAYDEAIAEREKFVDERMQQKANFEDLFGAYTSANDIKRATQEILPTEENIPELISALQQMSRDAGVGVKALSVTATGGGKDAKATGSVMNVGIALSAQGSYGSIKTLLSFLERNRRIIDVATVDFAPSAIDTTLIDVTISANAYVAPAQATKSEEKPPASTKKSPSDS
ncbi:MAG: type 4a pilus biogenesis protein PilO [Patescibacteria group bacterium]